MKKRDNRDYKPIVISFYLLPDDNVHHRDRHVAALSARAGIGTEVRGIRVALEHVDIAFAAVKNHLLFQHRNTVKFLTSSATNTSLKVKLDIKADVDGIEAPVELYGIDMNGRPANRSSLYPNIPGTLQNLVAEIGQKYPHVFVAITIAAAVQNAIGLDTDHLTPTPGRSGARKFVFCHGPMIGL